MSCIIINQITYLAIRLLNNGKMPATKLSYQSSFHQPGVKP